MKINIDMKNKKIIMLSQNKMNKFQNIYKSNNIQYI